MNSDSRVIELVLLEPLMAYKPMPYDLEKI